jgi:hypothetical protein
MSLIGWTLGVIGGVAGLVGIALAAKYLGGETVWNFFKGIFDSILNVLRSFVTWMPVWLRTMIVIILLIPLMGFVMNYLIGIRHTCGCEAGVNCSHYSVYETDSLVGGIIGKVFPDSIDLKALGRRNVELKSPLAETGGAGIHWVVKGLFVENGSGQYILVDKDFDRSKQNKYKYRFDICYNTSFRDGQHQCYVSAQGETCMARPLLGGYSEVGSFFYAFDDAGKLYLEHFVLENQARNCMNEYGDIHLGISHDWFSLSFVPSQMNITVNGQYVLVKDVEIPNPGFFDFIAGESARYVPYAGKKDDFMEYVCTDKGNISVKFFGFPLFDPLVMMMITFIIFLVSLRKIFEF